MHDAESLSLPPSGRGEEEPHHLADGAAISEAHSRGRRLAVPADRQHRKETERARAEAAALVAENESMREFRVEFQHQTTTQANTHCDELQKQLRARDADNARLRGQRDEINAELLERRARDSARPSQVDEVRAILGPKDERIAALTSQVRRLEQELSLIHI